MTGLNRYPQIMIVPSTMVCQLILSINELVQQHISSSVGKYLSKQVREIFQGIFLCDATSPTSDRLPAHVVQYTVMLLAQLKVRHGGVLVYCIVISKHICGTVGRYSKHA